MHLPRTTVLIASIFALGLAGCSSPANPDPKAAASGSGGPETKVASSADSPNGDMPFPKLEKGMTADTIRKLLGEPKEIQPTPSPEGKAEIWIYNFEKDLGMVQVAGGTRTVDVMPSVAMGSNTATMQEPVYTMADRKAEITLSLLMFDGKLAVQKAKVVETLDHHS